MKFKHLGRQIVALLLSLCLAVGLLPSLPTSAYSVPAVGNGVGEAGSAGISGVWDITYSPGTTPFGCRVTLMDKSTGMPALGYNSIDYTNDKSVADRVTMHAAKFCKSDCLKNGTAMVLYDGVTSKRDYGAKTLSPKDGSGTVRQMPMIIDNSNATAVRDYFCTDYVLAELAPDFGVPYDELISGKYKLLIEPIHYFHKYGSTDEMAFTATEYAILALNGADYSSISNCTRNAIPLALFLEDDDPDLGYSEYAGDTNANWHGISSASGLNGNSSYSDSGALRLGYQTIFDKSLGMAIVPFPENTKPHVYDLQITVPKSFPLDSTGNLVGAAGAQKLFDNSKANGGLNAVDAAMMMQLLQLDENKNKLNDPTNWRVLADYDLITDNSLMGVYTASNKQKYYASKDNRYMAELSTRLDNYLEVSSESTIIMDPTDAYSGPEIRGYNSNTVVHRYGGTTDEKYHNTNTNTTYLLF